MLVECINDLNNCNVSWFLRNLLCLVFLKSVWKSFVP